MFLSYQHAARAMVCALTIFAAGLVPAMAQDAAASHRQAAREAILATHANDQLDQILPVLAEQAKALFLRSNPAIVQVVDEVVNEVAIELAGRRPELNREVENIWMATFSEEELRAITEFYNSDVGGKLGRAMPGIIQESLGAAGIWRDALSTEIVEMSRERLIERGHQF
jgi:hypothetical protein